MYRRYHIFPLLVRLKQEQLGQFHLCQRHLISNERSEVGHADLELLVRHGLTIFGPDDVSISRGVLADLLAVRSKFQRPRHRSSTFEEHESISHLIQYICRIVDLSMLCSRHALLYNQHLGHLHERREVRRKVDGIRKATLFFDDSQYGQKTDHDALVLGTSKLMVQQ